MRPPSSILFSLTIAAAGQASSFVAEESRLGPLGRSHPRDLHHLEKRENCGPGIGSCADGLCCSQWNWCGDSGDHCAAGCQPDYGRCTAGGGGGGDAPRPQFGSVPYGVRISTCNVPGTIAITFDDGPFIYTSELLDLLSQYGVRSTFFINGNNWGDATQAPYPDVLRRMIVDGHQIGSHTWSHADLDTLDSAGRRQQMTLLEDFMVGILGYFPTYMRPPYGRCGGACQADMASLGYHVVIWNIDTLDYNNQGPSAIQESMNIFDGAVSPNPAGNAYISLEHDVHPWTVQALAEHIIQTAQGRGYRAVTVGECLGDPSVNWYRDGATGEAIGGSTNPPDPPGPTDPPNPPDPVDLVSPDGTCGGTGGYTCQGSGFGDCCSQWGWCGSTGEYCNTGCQPAFGVCNGGEGLAQSPDGTCAGNSDGRYTCSGSAFGNCCSQYGWCGRTPEHCGAGCQSGFGDC